MADILTWGLDADGDLDLTDGRFRRVTGAEAVCQRLRMRLGTWLSEWFLDIRKGIDYRGQVFVKRPDLSVISALMREQIVTCPDVVALDYFRPVWDRATRHLSVSFRASTIYGPIEGIPEGEPMGPAMLILLIRPIGAIMPA